MKYKSNWSSSRNSAFKRKTHKQKNWLGFYWKLTIKGVNDECLMMALFKKNDLEEEVGTINNGKHLILCTWIGRIESGSGGAISKHPGYQKII